MPDNVRVRFAPSPTGPLHIGGVRTALFNYLFARKHQGTFVLRIEDTDQNRYVPGAEAYIVESLEWLGIPFDEGPGKPGGHGPYRQSERQDIYRNYADQLVSKGWAYYAFDSPESLEQHRKSHEAKGKTFIYNWHNRLKLDNSLVLGPEEVKSRMAAGEPYTIRFKWPQDEYLLMTDQVRGTIRIDTNTLDDKVLFKADGMPTYHLANIVDDHLMQITHVIRGEEWLPSLPLHVKLYEAFDWPAPEFAHLPLILKPSGKGKLSKRDGEKLGFPVFPLSWNESPGYRESGYFPETVVNFLALLGWNPGTEQELFELDQLVQAFDLERVNKSGARFDPDKNKWYNHQYLQKKPIAELVPPFRNILETNGVSHETFSDSYLESVIALLRERADFLREIWTSGSYFFSPPKSFDEKAASKKWKAETPAVMQEVLKFLLETERYESESLEASFKEWLAKKGYSFGQVMPALRLALVGAMEGPHIFDIIALIGKKETLARIQYALETL